MEENRVLRKHRTVSLEIHETLEVLRKLQKAAQTDWYCLVVDALIALSRILAESLEYRKE